MDLVDNCLEKTFERKTTNSEWDAYRAFKGDLEKDIYPDIGTGVALADGTLLTDHGINHIETVIARASNLLLNLDENNELSPFEMRILLTAILIHDIGNIYRREMHAERSTEILSKYKKTNLDNIEKRTIAKIAQAHSGKEGLDDAWLQLEERVNGEVLRPRLLASILRMADELADDRTRSCHNKTIKIPKCSEIYHLYAYCLHSVYPEEKTINLKFEVEKDFLCKKWGKDQGTIFLIDEILLRTLKTFNEMHYCNLSMPPEMRLERVKVCIEIYKNPSVPEMPINLNYVIESSGYPQHFKSIFDVCPGLCQWGKDKIKLSGQALFDEYC